MTRVGFLLVALILSLGFFLPVPEPAFADMASDIQAQIDANNQQLEALKAEIASFQKQLQALGAKKNTLQSAIDSLSLSQKQLATQIKVTHKMIPFANLEIK